MCCFWQRSLLRVRSSVSAWSDFQETCSHFQMELFRAYPTNRMNVEDHLRKDDLSSMDPNENIRFARSLLSWSSWFAGLKHDENPWAISYCWLDF